MSFIAYFQTSKTSRSFHVTAIAERENRALIWKTPKSEPRRSCETIGNPQWRSFPFSRGRPPRLALVIRPRPPTMSRNFHEYARLVMRTFPLPTTTGAAAHPRLALRRQKPPSLFPMTVRFLELRISHESACPVAHVCVCGSGPSLVSGQCFSDAEGPMKAPFSPLLLLLSRPRRRNQVGSRRFLGDFKLPTTIKDYAITIVNV